MSESAAPPPAPEPRPLDLGDDDIDGDEEQYRIAAFWDAQRKPMWATVPRTVLHVLHVVTPTDDPLRIVSACGIGMAVADAVIYSDPDAAALELCERCVPSPPTDGQGEPPLDALIEAWGVSDGWTPAQIGGWASSEHPTRFTYAKIRDLAERAYQLGKDSR